MKYSDHDHFYGRRKGRPMNESRLDAFDKVAQRFIIPDEIVENDTIIPQQIIDKPEIWFEIGFGNGEHLVEQAKRNPNIGLIGCEPYINGVAFAARDIVANELENIRLWPDDAMQLLSRFPDNSIDRLFLLFNDPWPKIRHHKRRFIQDHTVELLARILKPGAQLRLTTDDRPLAEWMLLHTVANPKFIWDNWQNAEWSVAPEDWVETRYQQKAAQQGRLAHFMDFTRI